MSRAYKPLVLWGLMPAVLLFDGKVLYAEESGEFNPEVLRRIVTERAAKERQKVFVDFAGQTIRVELLSADGEGMKVSAMGMEVDLPWRTVSLKRLTDISARFCRSAEEWYQVGLAYKSLDLMDAADEAFRKAVELDGSIAARLKGPAPTREPEPESGEPASVPDDSAGTAPESRAVPAGPERIVYPPSRGRTPKGGGIRAEHPRLFYTPDKLQWLRSAGRGSANFATLRTYSLSDDRYGGLAPWKALVYLAEGSLEHGRGAVAQIKSETLSKGVIRDLNAAFPATADAALVYDWCYPLLDEETKQAFIDWFNAEFDAMRDTYVGLSYHNYNCAPAWAFTAAGYAAYGDNPRAMEMVNNGVRQRFEGDISKTFTEGNAGGAWAEGEGYGYTTVPDLIYLAEVARTAAGKDYFDTPAGRSFYFERLAYMMLAHLPGSDPPQWFIRGDGARGGNLVPAWGQLLALAGFYTGTSRAAYARDFIRRFMAQAPYRSAAYYGVLFDDPSLPGMPLERFRLSHHARGQGVVLMRSDWTDDATHVGFICGDHYSYHQHADSGSFQIWRGGYLAVDSGEYDGNGGSAHARNYHSRTIAHNSIILAGYENATLNLRGSAQDDGGQPIPKVERFIETGDIIAYDPQRAYCYAAGDATRSFQGRLQRWVRHIVFVRPNVIVVYDTVQAPAEHPPVWLLHTWEEPEVDGMSFTASHDGGRLSGRVVLPEACRIDKVQGCRVGGRNYPSPRNPTADWRMEMHPEPPAPAAAFVVVLWTSKAADTSKLDIQRLPDKGGVFGIGIGGGLQVWLRRDGRPGGSIVSGGSTYNLAGSIRPDAD